MAAILEREPPRVSSFQPLATTALDRVVSTCLAKDPDDRWQTARDLLRELQWMGEWGAQAGDANGVVGRTKRRPVSAALTIAALAVVGAASYFAGARTAPERATTVRVDRLTDFPGIEEFPALSPDGRSVAFTADEGGSRQIWVRLIAGGPPLQITRDGTEHTRPRWSPDSSSLIYSSPPDGRELTGTLWEVAALGGTPRRIVESVADGDISHDGISLAFIRSVEGRLELVVGNRDGTNAKVIVRLDPGYSYVAPRWSPDDRFIAYQRIRMSLDDDVFVVPSAGGEPRGITHASTRMSGFAWLPDGSGIVVSSSRGSTLYYLPTFNLWTVPLNGGDWRQDTFGEVSYLYPDVDRIGALVATRLQLRSNIWRYPVDFTPIDNVGRGVQITRQTGQVRTPTVSPDDKEVAYVSDSGGHANLWVTKLESGESRQITHERNPETSVGVPVWSPDGRSIAFASSRDAPAGQNGYWIVRPDGSGLRNLRSFGGWAAWSGDGRWVYYSEDPRRLALSKVPVDGGEPVLVRADTATRPAISRDGSTLYWLVELLAGSGLADYEIRMASPESGPARTLVRIPGRRVPIWLMIHPVISPDGKWLALPLVDNGTANIWAVSTADGAFRQLTDFGRRSTFIARRVSWSSDGRSIFAALGEGEADVVLLAGVTGR
jgi:eukaryotic-like serine/threonine-protein kinase